MIKPGDKVRMSEALKKAFMKNCTANKHVGPFIVTTEQVDDLVTRSQTEKELELLEASLANHFDIKNNVREELLSRELEDKLDNSDEVKLWQQTYASYLDWQRNNTDCLGCSIDHIKEFGDCIGIVIGLVDYGSQQGPEVDVRWQPSNLRYGYHPDLLDKI